MPERKARVRGFTVLFTLFLAVVIYLANNGLAAQFFIGSSSAGDKQAEAVIDEFMLYDRPLEGAVWQPAGQSLSSNSRTKIIAPVSQS